MYFYALPATDVTARAPASIAENPVAPAIALSAIISLSPNKVALEKALGDPGVNFSAGGAFGLKETHTVRRDLKNPVDVTFGIP